ncbi:MAG: pyridoxamine 5'-phosphate oxidase family protein [Bacteroidales bacterium]|nr:pyridoxamine 5'-phosphate oxidase family protein [Bacteroidales bacterium]
MDPVANRMIDGSWKKTEEDPDLIRQSIEKAEKLLQRTKIVVFVSLDAQGNPMAKALLVAATKKLKHLYFSTNTSSRHIRQIRANPIATVYFFDPQTLEGVMLSGHATEEPDHTWREKIWEDYYTYSGVDDPDYCILRFDAETGNYYQNLSNVSFDVT